MGGLTDERRREALAIQESAVSWASSRPGVVAVGLIGSWARGTATTASDVDLVVLAADALSPAADEHWPHFLPDGKLLRVRSWGSLTERRVRLPSGLEVDLGLAEPSWAGTGPVDPGTRKVVREGMKPLYDPQGYLDRLAVACSIG